jgi:purine-binding chemotaxis protein CheW
VRHLLEFEVAQQRYALQVSQVKEVLPRPALTPLQDGPAAVVGILRLRGSLVLVVDLRRRLGLPPVAPRLSQCVVVLFIEGDVVGILVDGVDGLISVDGPDVAVGAARAGRMVERIVETSAGVVTVLDAEAIVGTEVRSLISALTDMHGTAAEVGTTVTARSAVGS